MVSEFPALSLSLSLHPSIFLCIDKRKFCCCWFLEELCPSSTADVKKDWSSDYDKLLGPLIEANVPCYLLYRLDTKTSLGFAWLLVSWVPETASIRQKMVYASTKASLKTEFGTAYITEELHATIKEEMTWDGYCRHRKCHTAPAPLTSREEELAELRKTEVNTEISTDTRQQTLSGVSCPLSTATEETIRDLLKGNYNYLQFRIDLEAEQIHISLASKLKSVQELAKQVPNDQARYHLYQFQHQYEGDYLEPFVFIYSMPGYTCSVRERMMYSSCKGQFLEKLQSSFGITIAKKVFGPCISFFFFFFVWIWIICESFQLEIDNGSELTEEYLLDELHPKIASSQRPAFAKPKGPPNRGARRLTKQQD